MNPRETAIITGASRGIGAVIATHLAKIGYAVVIGYSRDSSPTSAATTPPGSPAK